MSSVSLTKIAAAIGETADAARFTAAHTKLKAAFHARFYDPEAGGYAPCVDAVPSALRCPEGETLDSVGADGDDGSCDCDDFCASDWNGKIKKARPHWTGAASAVPGAHTDCMCVQGSHWCPKSGACASSCKALGKPKAEPADANAHKTAKEEARQDVPMHGTPAEESDDEVLETCAPPAPIQKEVEMGEDDDDDVMCTGRSGANALSDFPHARENCATKKWTSGLFFANTEFCANCFCFVCGCFP